MKTETQTSDKKILTDGYLPLPDFMAIMKERHTHPYRTSLSFEPFFRQYKERLADHGIYDAEMAEWVRQSILTASTLNEQQSVLKAVAQFLPALFVDDGLNFLSSPFKKDFLYLSPSSEDLLTSPEWEIQVSDRMMNTINHNSIFEVCNAILNKCYDQPIECSIQNDIFIRNRTTGLEKCYQLRMDMSHIEVLPLVDLIPLSLVKIQELLRTPEDTELWLSHFPPENFEFKGFMLGSMIDVTSHAMLDRFKDLLAQGHDHEPPDVYLPKFAKVLGNFLGMPDVEVGFIGIKFAQFFDTMSFSLTQVNDINKLSKKLVADEELGIYGACVRDRKVVFCEDLSTLSNPSEGEKILLQRGYKSVILFPATDSDGTIPMINEIGSKKPNAFNNLSIIELEPVFEFMQEGSDSFLSEMESLVNLFIQEQFTSIHPSVLWKFEDVARKYQLLKSLPDFHGSIDEIAFKDVYPLYGQADIVGSSHIRNKHIKDDLLRNLELVRNLLELWKENVNLYLLDSILDRVKSLHSKLKVEFISRDETEVVDILHNEVHPYLKQLAEQYEDLLIEEQQAYFNTLDPELQILYLRRKSYEQSVSKLVQSISELIERKNTELQTILPHYFEKYKTDGVEYNLYVGQSILQKGKFHSNHLREFRLWQLINMCEITRLVQKIGPELPVLLETAQLIFVYNTSLSIRFRMDEKQFDVDGTYNVRYEILKKRIDKATIKGRKERLTLANTISIVYLQEKDRTEYEGYMKYLADHRYISPDYEDLELEKLQGAEGLRALRVKVLDISD